MSVYFHGGAPGLKPGDMIEPRPDGETGHLIDGCPICEARRRGDYLPDDDLDPTLVYVTPDRDYARVYAAGYPKGGLYRVTPVGDLSASPDPVASWGCRAAHVESVLDPLVVLSRKDVRRLSRKYGRAA